MTNRCTSKQHGKAHVNRDFLAGGHFYRADWQVLRDHCLVETDLKTGIGLFLAFILYKLIFRPLLWYLRDPLELRKYPAAGHGIAGFTNLWNAYQVIRLRRFKVVHKAHQQLGPVIRIQPDHLSFNEPEAASQIYGHGSKVDKGDFYEIFRSAGGEENIVGTRDRAEHSRKRKMIAAGFAMTNVVQMQPAMNEAVQDYLTILDAEAQGSGSGLGIELRKWMNLLTFDIIGIAGYGETMGFVKQGHDWAPAQSRDGCKEYLTQAIEPFHEVSVLESILGLWPEYLPSSRRMLWWTPMQRHGTAFIDMCVRKLRARCKRGPPAAFKDLFGHYLTDRHGKELNLPFEELVSESNVILNAGSDTTATAMTNILYLLIKHDAVRQKLLDELDAVLGAEDVIPTYDQVKDLPYLRACVDEALRLRPPLSLGLPRKTTADTTIAGHIVKAGVTVSVPTWSLHHNESLFPNADAFVPERWLEEDTENLKRYVMPFSQGPRACLGRNLAFLEMLTIVPTMMRRYEFAFIEPDFELPAIDRHVANPGDCHIFVRFRRQKSYPRQR